MPSWSARTPRKRPTTSRRMWTSGPHPETFFGVHPYIVQEGKQDILLKHLVEWKDDLILQHAAGLPERARRGLPPAIRRPPRARHRAHHRAAGGLGRLRHAPGAERGQDHLQGPALQGRDAPTRAPPAPSGRSWIRSTGRSAAIRTSTRTATARPSRSQRPSSPAARKPGSTTTPPSSAASGWW